CPPPVALLRDAAHPGQPMPSDSQLVAATDALEGGTGEMPKAATELRDATQAALDRAHQAAIAAARAEARAGTRGEAHHHAQQAERARREIADCEAALDILAETIPQLRAAVADLQMVPADLLETYEAAYRLVFRGGKLPLSGDFLTGSQT